MKINKSKLERIVREELVHRMVELREAPKDDKPKDVDVSDAEKDKKGSEKKSEKEPKKDDKKPSPKAGPDKPKDAPTDKKGPEPKEPPANEPADSDADAPSGGENVDDGTEAPDQEEADEVTGGEIAKEITGQTVQSITMEPKSKIMPGAQEIVITFNQKPEPLRILIGKTGQVKFFYRGLHNEL